MTITPSIINAVLALMVLTAIAIFFAYQIYIFTRDLRFYRGANWDLSLDSGNELFFFEILRRSTFFGKYPVGYLRLSMGYQLSVFVLMVLVTGPFFRVLSQSSDSEADEQFIAFAWIIVCLVYFLLYWMMDVWLYNMPGWPRTEPSVIETYIGKRFSPKFYMTVKHVFLLLLVLLLAYSVVAMPDAWQLNRH